MKTALFFFFLVAFVSIEGKRCPRTNSKPFRYCTDSCSSSEDCKRNEKCLCDGDCGLSCVKNGVNCGKPPTPKNSRKPEVKSSTFNSIVTYTCNANHKLRGSKKRVCRAIGEWDGKKARCKLFCPTLKDMRYGNSRVDKKGPKVTFWCWQGYKLEGHRMLTCQSNGNWDHPQPVCSPPTCPTAQLPDNAVIVFPRRIPKVYTLGSRVQFSCKSGYFRQGIAIQQCNHDGWTKSRFSCIPKTCGDPGTPLNGKKIGYQYTFKKKVRYTCDLGYRLKGAEYRQCQVNQRWTGQTVKCEAVDCGSLRAPAHGEILGETKTTYQGRITFRCTDTGYEMKGSRERICQANGQWNGEETKCELIKCEVPEIPKNGRHVVSIGYVYTGSVRFACDTNYTISNSAAIHCQLNKKWSGRSPYCSAPCRDPGIPKNSRRMQNNFLHNNKVTFRCVGQNYVMKGAAHIICTDGRWDKDPPKCFSPCPSLYKPVNGRIYGSDFRHEKRVDFRCYYGYQIIGASSVTCYDGKWNRDPPVCKGICPGQGRLTNGYTVAPRSQYLEGHKLEYRCSNGFDLFGETQIYCRSRKWNAAKPYCGERCRVPGTPQHGSVEQETLRIGRNQFRHDGGEIKYQCHAGYSMVGDATVRCSNGRWSKLVPQCKADCNEPRDISNGRIIRRELQHGSSATYECNTNYTLSGREQLTCHDGTWLPNPPTCKASCPSLDDPAHGWRTTNDFRHDSKVHFECADGYEITGSQLVTCNNGKWDRQPPVCRGICQDLGRLQDVNHSPKNLKYFNGDTVKFWCRQGTDLFGTRAIHCQGRRWNATTPACKRRCGHPGRPLHGSVLEEKMRKGNTFVHGSGEIRYQCDSNYTMVGDSAVVRCNNGGWTNQVPECKASCNKPGIISHGTMEGNDFRHDKSVTYSCQRGYKLIGQARLTCMDGNWDAKLPECKVPCSQPDVPINGWKRGGDFRHEFGCDNGYRAIGHPSSTCTNGIWNAEPIVCVGICQDPGTPRHGYRRPDQTTYFEGVTVRFRCNNNFDLSGTRENLYCHDRKWNGSLPDCKKRCTISGKLPIGLVMLSEAPFPRTLFRDGERVGYKCQAQFSMVGDATLVCNNGKWSNSFPQCKASCREPRNITNGTMSGKDFRHGQAVTYVCNANYMLFGERQLTCNDGTWSGNPPACKKAFRCDFDSSDCGFVQSKTDNFDWTRQEGRTLSSGTGPSSDVSGSGHYMFIEASQRFWGAKARIEKRGFMFNGNQCLTFYYHMLGGDVGTLEVFVGQTEEFSISGSQGDKWKREDLKIKGNSDTLAFVATVYYWSSDIAIDDITVYDCQ